MAASLSSVLPFSALCSCIGDVRGQLLASKDMARRKEGTVWLSRVKELAKTRSTVSSSSASSASRPYPATGTADTEPSNHHTSTTDEDDSGDPCGSVALPWKESLVEASRNGSDEQHVFPVTKEQQQREPNA